MKVIDSDNYAASGIETFFFPGGEPHARIPKDFGDALLYLKARTWNDVGLAVCVLDALNEQDTGMLEIDKRIWLFAPYFPGARQDRSDGQTPVTAHIMLNLISLYADRGYTFDVHSKTVGDVVYKNFMPSDLYLRHVRSVEYFKDPWIIIPDAGAKERCRDFDQMYGGFHKPMIQCDKKRDFATGKFTGFSMPPLPKVGNYLIVDDICDGGSTFNLLAEEFLKDPYGPKSTLELWVSHGIFSKGVSNLHPKISKIYTTDSWCQYNELHFGPCDKRVEVISLQPFIDNIIKECEDERARD